MKHRPFLSLLCLSLLSGLPFAGLSGEPAALAPAEQAEQYAAEVAKTVVELQPFSQTRSQPVCGPDGRCGTATLIDLSPQIGVWYLLRLAWEGGEEHYYHLENAAPGRQLVALDAGFADGLLLESDGARHHCPLWSGPMLSEAASEATPYASLCGGRLYLHNAVRGRRSDLEAVVEFLRDHVWGGEEVVTLAKETLLRDQGREQAEIEGKEPPVLAPAHGGLPSQARLGADNVGREIGRGSLDIAVDAPAWSDLPLGAWTPARDVAGVYLSLMTPEAIAPQILQSRRDHANALDAKESSALVYLIAFDLNRYTLGFGLGTDHPQVGWSPRVPADQLDTTLPGPDGIADIKPLIATGMIPPSVAAQTVGSFAGGFKRYHGAFHYGDLSRQNHGSHYGFIQEGVVLSKLQPGLATLYMLDDGSVHMQTWSKEDNQLLARIRYARQNGVPVVEWDAATAQPVPGALVNNWGAGNWSGSAEKSLRTVRAAACMQQNPPHDYLIYAYFSNATPSAMARVLQAYDCRYAMQFDINAPILTYLALYPGGGREPAVQYLVQPMSEADRTTNGRPVPRFLGLPDNRDFFYVVRRGDETL